MAVYCKTQAQADAELDEWLQQALGVSMAGPWGNQCSRLVQQHARDIFGLSPYETLGYGNARDHITNAKPAYYQAVWNDPRNATLLPRRSDVMIWDGKPLWDGKLYGHTGVTDRPTATSVRIVQQDGAAAPTALFPDGRRYSVKPAHHGQFAYVTDPAVGSARGWLRPNWKRVVYTGADKRLGRTAAATPAAKAAPASRVLDWIDISDYQPTTVIRDVKTDAVVIKATEGVGWKADNLPGHVAAARAKKLPYMLYHFARATLNGSSAEVAHFLRVAAPYHADPLFAGLVLDFEEDAVMHYGRWGEDFLAEIRRKHPDIRLALYTRAGFLAATGWSQETKNQTPVWIAAYGTDRQMNGYATDFAGAPRVAGWSISAWQYSQRGRLPGYGRDLDLNRTLTSGRVPMWPAPAATSSDDLMEWIVTNEQLARKIINDEARKAFSHMMSPNTKEGRIILARIGNTARDSIRNWKIPGLGSAKGPMTFEQSHRHERDERGKNIGARTDIVEALGAIVEAQTHIITRLDALERGSRGAHAATAPAQATIGDTQTTKEA